MNNSPLALPPAFFPPSFLPSSQLNSDSATDDATSNHVDSFQQSQESACSSILTEEATPTPPLTLPHHDGSLPETAHSDSASSQPPEVGAIGSWNKLWCTGAF